MKSGKVTSGTSGTRPALSGKVVRVGIAVDTARRLGRVLRSREVHERARELMPAAGRLLSAMHREWVGLPTPESPLDRNRSRHRWSR